jgi:hypothetical protein
MVNFIRSIKVKIKSVNSYKKLAIILCFAMVIFILSLAVRLSINANQVERNNQALMDSILSIKEDTKTVNLNQIVPFKWTKLYIFDPYLDVARQEEIIGFKSDELDQSNNEGMLYLVFVDRDTVVSSVLAYPDSLGYNFRLGTDYIELNIDYTMIRSDENMPLKVAHENGIITLNYKVEEAKAVSDGENLIPIIAPDIEKGMELGADGVILDYADGDIVIFHGYFGLFIYSINMGEMVGAVDLSSIGCDKTQGDNYCEVNVSADGTIIYLHPLNEDDMYVYKVSSQNLWKESYSLVGIELFNQFIDSSVIDNSYVGNIVEFVVEDYRYYGYLMSKDGSIENLYYREDDMIVPLFEDYFDRLTRNTSIMSVVRIAKLKH